MTDVQTTDIKQIMVLPDPEISEKKRARWYNTKVQDGSSSAIWFAMFLLCGCVAAILQLDSMSHGVPPNFMVLAGLVGCGIVSFLLFLIFLVRDLKKLRCESRIWEADRAEREDYEDLRARIRRFNARLRALKEIAANVTEEKRPGPDVVATCTADHQELTMLLRPYADAVREEKVLNAQRTIADNDDPRFRATSDVTVAAYVAQLRLADEDTGTAVEPLPEEDESEPTAARVGGA